jgi:hypothetical protein
MADDVMVLLLKFSYKKKQWRPPSKKDERREKKNLSPRNRKACHE